MGSTQDLVALGLLQDPEIRDLGAAMAEERRLLASERGTPELAEDLPSFNPFSRLARGAGAALTSPFRLLPGKSRFEEAITIDPPKSAFARSFRPGAQGEAALTPEEAGARTDSQLALLRGVTPRAASQTLGQLERTGRAGQVERTRLRGGQPARPHEQVAGRIVRLPLEEGEEPEIVTDLPPKVIEKSVTIDGKPMIVGVSGDRQSLFILKGPEGQEAAFEPSAGPSTTVNVDLGKPAQAELEKRIISDVEVRDNLNFIRSSFDPKFFRRPEKLRLFAQNFVASFGANFLGQDALDNIQSATTLRQALSTNLNALVKAITGAQMSEAETARIKLQTVNANDNEVQAETKLRNQLILIDISLARSLILRNKGINEGVATLLGRGERVPTFDEVGAQLLTQGEQIYSNALIRMTGTATADAMETHIDGLPEAQQIELFRDAMQEASNTMFHGNADEGIPAWKVDLQELIDARDRGLLVF